MIEPADGVFNCRILSQWCGNQYVASGEIDFAYVPTTQADTLQRLLLHNLWSRGCLFFRHLLPDETNGLSPTCYSFHNISHRVTSFTFCRCCHVICIPYHIYNLLLYLHSSVYVCTFIRIFVHMKSKICG